MKTQWLFLLVVSAALVGGCAAPGKMDPNQPDCALCVVKKTDCSTRAQCMANGGCEGTSGCSVPKEN